MALDAASAALLAQMAQHDLPPLTRMTVAQARELGASLSASVERGPDVGEIHDWSVPVQGDTIVVRTYQPLSVPTAVLVYFHGGGWVMGHIDELDRVARDLTTRTGAVVAMVGYRKAPEQRYPTAVDDAWAATQWADTHRRELAGEPVPLIVAGDSAGGNLAAVVAARAKQQSLDLSLQILIYPVTDCDFQTPSYLDPANQLLLDRESMQWFWDHYVPDPAERTRPTASPLRADDLAGLAPALVLTAEHDVLRDEGEAYAERLRAAGVPTRVRRFAGQMHGFFTLDGVLPGADVALDHIATEVHRHLTASSTPDTVVAHP